MKKLSNLMLGVSVLVGMVAVTGVRADRSGVEILEPGKLTLGELQTVFEGVLRKPGRIVAGDKGTMVHRIQRRVQLPLLQNPLPKGKKLNSGLGLHLDVRGKTKIDQLRVILDQQPEGVPFADRPIVAAIISPRFKNPRLYGDPKGIKGGTLEVWWCEGLGEIAAPRGRLVDLTQHFVPVIRQALRQAARDIAKTLRRGRI